MRTEIIRNLSGKIGGSLPLPLYCRVINLRNSLRSKKHRISTVEGDFIHSAYDGDDKIYLCRRGRHNRYKSGVLSGVSRLAADYHLNKIAIKTGGLLIDCGANIGELGIWAQKQGLSYIGFEPEELEARCNDLNNFNALPKTIRKALWKTNTELEFFTKPGTADSSLFDMGTAETVERVQAVTLDSTVNIAEGKYKGTVIFKLEAEGAEPEVLEGATKSLAHIDYVAVDCGCERGVEKKHTFVETNTFLQDHGYRLQDAAFRRVTALYKNTRR